MTELLVGAQIHTQARVEVTFHEPDRYRNDPGPSLGEVESLLVALNAFVIAAAYVHFDNENRQSQFSTVASEGRIPQVFVSKISMNSPLYVELAATGGLGAGVLSALVFLFKNPDKLGAWIPKIQLSWYNGRAEVEKARKAYEKLRKARTQMRELQ